MHAIFTGFLLNIIFYKSSIYIPLARHQYSIKGIFFRELSTYFAGHSEKCISNHTILCVHKYYLYMRSVLYYNIENVRRECRHLAKEFSILFSFETPYGNVVTIKFIDFHPYSIFNVEIVQVKW